MEIASKPKQRERRELWRKLNSLKMERPMVNVNKFMWWQELYPDADTLRCCDPACRETERYLLQCLLHDDLDDDTVIEPWVELRSIYGRPYITALDMGETYWAENAWGIAFKRRLSDMEFGAWAFDPAIVELDDAKKLVLPVHTIDEQKTMQRFDAVSEAIDGVMPVVMDRGPMIRTYCGSVIPDLCLLRGLEQVMFDMYDNPEWLHELLAFMTNGVKGLHAQAEQKGDLRLINQFNQTMPYCEDVADPSPDTAPVKRKQLWHYFEAQEFSSVSPEQYWEFAAQYHKTMAEEYALVAYGCCEDLTNVIPYLKRIPNLRSIAVSPWANVKKCAAQIGGDYVLSWRPNPADTLCNAFDADYVRATLKQGLEDARGCNVEINLKDAYTIRKDLASLKEWVRIAKELAERF